MPAPVSESVFGNMVIQSLEHSKLGSTIKDPFKESRLKLFSPSRSFGTKHVWVHEQVALRRKRFKVSQQGLLMGNKLISELNT